MDSITPTAVEACGRHHLDHAERGAGKAVSSPNAEIKMTLRNRVVRYR